MVAKAQVYMCQYCGALYLEEKDAIDCEENHINYEHLNIIDSRIWDKDYEGFPTKILIEDKRMSGSAVEYIINSRPSSIEDFYEDKPWNELGEYGDKNVNDRLVIKEDEEED